MPKISELTDSGAIRPGDSVPAVRSGSTVEVWPTVEQPASVSGTDTYTSDLGVDVAAGDKVCGDFANPNTSPTPTWENTGGTPSALTITTKDGSALWSGALSGVHTLQLASGGESWLVLDPIGDPRYTKMIGEPFPVMDDLTGVNAPNNDGAAKFIKLTAGEDGAGDYNEGLLTNESVTGTAPLVVATADIDHADSPMNGQTVPLINTENRYLMPGASPGTVANDQMQQITGDIRVARAVLTSPNGAFDFEESGSNGGSDSDNNADQNLLFDSANSPGARTGDHTNVKRLQVTYYMRIA